MKLLTSAMVATFGAAATLRELGDELGVLMGSAINMYHAEDQKYDEYFKSEHSIAVATYECKMNIIRPTKDTWRLDRCVLAFEYAIEHGMEFRGHALVWGATNKVPNIVPGWLKWETDAATLDSELKDHI